MYNIIFNKYIVLILSIGMLYYIIFRFKFKTKMKAKDEIFWKSLIFISSSTGLLVALSEIMGLGNKLLFPIAGCVFLSFVLLTVNAWKVRKLPQARVYCNIYFGIMIFLILFIIVVIILAKLGFYG